MAKRRASGEGNIRKRSDGRWEGRYVAGHDENGKAIRKNVLGKTQAEVREKLKAAIEESQDIDVSRADEYTVGKRDAGPQRRGLYTADLRPCDRQNAGGGRSDDGKADGDKHVGKGKNKQDGGSNRPASCFVRLALEKHSGKEKITMHQHPHTGYRVTLEAKVIGTVH